MTHEEIRKNLKSLNENLAKRAEEANVDNSMITKEKLTFSKHFFDEAKCEIGWDRRKTNYSHEERNTTMLLKIGLGKKMYMLNDMYCNYPTYLTSTGLVVSIDERTNEIVNIIPYSFTALTTVRTVATDRKNLMKLKPAIDAANKCKIG